jgi:hypothetical protein
MANWYEPIAQAQEAENFRATQQQNRLALKVQQMQLGELEKQTGVKNFLSSNWRQMTAPVQDQPGPAPAPTAAPQPITNTLAPSPTPGAGLMNTMANPQPTPASPVGPLQPPGAAMSGQPAPMGPRMPTGGAPGGPAPAPDFPSDDKLMEAIQSGRITPEVADGVRAERVQHEAAQKQAYVQSKLGYLGELTKSAVANGDNETFQQIAKAAKDDPDLAPYLPKLDTFKITGKDEFHTVKQYTADEIKQVAAKFPQLGINPETTPPGAYKLGMKNGKPTDWEPKGGTGKPSDYPDFVKGFAYEHPELEGDALTAAANKEWHRMKVSENVAIGQGRIPVMQPVTGAFDPNTGAPIIFNRRTGETSISPVKGDVDVAAAKQDYAASTAALRDNEKRLTAMTTFTNRIDKTLPIVERLAKKYGNDFGGAVNKMRSNLKRGVGNTGDLKSLELALFALTGELTKTEMGSIGVAGASATQMEHMRSILSDSTNTKDIIAVLPTIKQLSEASKSAIKDVSDEIRKARKRSVGNVAKITAKDIREGQRFDIVIQGERRTGVKKNGKLIFDKAPAAGGKSADNLIKKYGF